MFEELKREIKKEITKNSVKTRRDIETINGGIIPADTETEIITETELTTIEYKGGLAPNYTFSQVLSRIVIFNNEKYSIKELPKPLPFYFEKIA